MLKSATVLGLLSAVGPFAIDMYLPALPIVAADLDGSIAAAQMTLTAYFIAFGVAQLVYGPLADQVGRKRQPKGDRFPRSGLGRNQQIAVDQVGICDGLLNLGQAVIALGF